MNLTFSYRGPIRRGERIECVEHIGNAMKPAGVRFDPPGARDWFRLSYPDGRTVSVDEAEKLLDGNVTYPGGIELVMVFVVRDDAPEADDGRFTFSLCETS